MLECMICMYKKIKNSGPVIVGGMIQLFIAQYKNNQVINLARFGLTIRQYLFHLLFEIFSNFTFRDLLKIYFNEH